MIRMATFNLNNLFDRFSFHAAIGESPRAQVTYRWHLNANRDVVPPPDDAPTVDADGNPIIEGEAPVHIEVSSLGTPVKPKPTDDLNALLTRTNRLNADVLAVQEVENIAALKEFNTLLDHPYHWAVLLEGNDPRFIDVGVLSRLPIGFAVSHRWVPDPAKPSEFLFSRDLLAVRVLNHGRDKVMFTLWVNHLKSKFVDPKIKDPAEIAKKKRESNDRRTRQAQGMHDIINAYHSVADPYIICGDFNEHPDNPPLDPLLRGQLTVRDVFEDGVDVDFENDEGVGPRITNREDIPPDENWTSRLSEANKPDVYERFDQILLSNSLHDVQERAKIQRRTHWSKNHAGSDHDPVYVDLNLEP